jgi:hypothetical protein
MNTIIVDDEILSKVYLLSLALIAKYQEQMKIQFDAFNRDNLIQNLEIVYASDHSLHLGKTLSQPIS